VSLNPFKNTKFFYWEKSSAGFYEAGKICGVKYDQEKYDIYILLCSSLSFLIPYKKICIVSRNPIFVGWDDNDRVHADNRAAIEYVDGFKVWEIKGARVPKFAVTEPKKQTFLED
jgi:hypothetical protein